MRIITLISATMMAVFAFAQNASQDLWHLEKYQPKMSTAIGWNEALNFVKDKEPKKVVVAVIDAGVDIYHPDLKENLWINEDEIADNGVDDDNNGYIDDVYGWNFIGGPEGNTSYDQLEITRQYVLLNEKYEFKPAEEIEDYDEYNAYQAMKKEYLASFQEARANYDFFQQLVFGMEFLEDEHGLDISIADLSNHKSATRSEEMARLVVLSSAKEAVDYTYESTKKDLMDAYDHFNFEFNYGYNPSFNGREFVNDDYSNGKEAFYGNNQVYLDKKFSDHGTHVAGIIAASADNDFGAKGICESCEIMSIRTVPQGDERDKDVANSIRYAVDNGAQIINMSFGKSYAHRPELVWDAIAYAKEKGVLLVHAAGNDGKDNDATDNFPNDKLDLYNETWIEVGASSWEAKPAQLANFSNYGQFNVDVFAPGVAIYSTTPENDYEQHDGTSMASPVVAGIAGFLMAYYPDLSAADVKNIIMKSAIPLKGKQTIPGGKKKTCLDRISVSGATVSLINAVKMAESKSNIQ